MRLGLWHRVFLLNAALIVAALAGVLWTQQRAFRAGLTDYLFSLDLERAERVAEALGAAHAQFGDWHFLRGRPRVFLDIVDRALAREPDAGQPVPDPRPRQARRPEPRPRPGAMPPARDAWLLGADSGLGPEPGPRPPRPRLRAGPMDLPSRLSVRDEAGVPVFGTEPGPRWTRLAIRVDAREVGSVWLAPLPEIGAQDFGFLRDQTRKAAVAGAVALLLALASSWWFGRRLFAPLRALNRGAQRMAAGDYAVRVSVQGTPEVAALGEDFNALAQALTAQRAAQRQWIADISHELRTPVSVLRGEVLALEDGVRPFTREALASLRGETERLTALIEDLYQLALADLGALNYRFEPVDLPTLVRAVAASHERALRSAGLTLEIDLPEVAVMVEGDERRLMQLFANLLGNAQRYTDRGGRVRVALRDSGAHAVVDIDDTAPGVPSEALPRLFERLYRVEGSRNRGSGGAGLGLAIARAIVEAHGGDIRAQHSPLGGLRVSVRLPRARSTR
jgi:two-component system sensor histidine kinase BaeS